MNPLLRRSFSDCVHYGINVRSNGKDGLASWQEKKKEIKDDYPELKFDCLFLKELVLNASALREKYNEDQYETQSEKEPFHFFLQLFNIPEKCDYKLSYVKLCQYAYNVGQFVAERSKKTYPEDIIEFTVRNPMMLTLDF